MITVRLQGGLGNQMFQYAAGRALSLLRGAPLALDVSAFGGDATRSYALGSFAVEAETVRVPRWRRLLQRMMGRRYCERGFAFDPRVALLSAETFLEGYFQSERYFETCAETIRSDFRLKGPLSQPAAVCLEEIEEGTSVAVHVRCGDYRNDARVRAFHGNCSPDYYRLAAQAMRERVGRARFFIFSDEPERAGEAFGDGSVVECHAAHESLFLMSRCAHQIIANSSFSWWGAWLNGNPDKIVIAPKPWFAEEAMERQTGDLIPQAWMRL